METTEMTTAVLNDLVEINNDRIAGYERAIKELKDEDSDLHTLFVEMIGESHQYKMELATELAASGEDIETGTTNRGKIYRVWMDLKATFSGSNRKAILESCEFGEDAALKVYLMALNESEIPAHLHALISAQAQSLKFSHDKIKTLRDIQQ